MRVAVGALLFLAGLASCSKPVPPPQIFEAHRKLQDGRECIARLEAVPDARVTRLNIQIDGAPIFIPPNIFASLDHAVHPEELIILDKGPTILVRFKLTDQNGPLTVGFVIKRNYISERELTRRDRVPEIVRYQAPPSPVTIAPLPTKSLN